MLSFVVPAYNEEALIAACIQSIIAEAGSVEYEIIVVDNGSTDSTAEVARSNGATVVLETRKGVTRARQAGFEASKYDLVAFIDADNEIPEGWLAVTLASMNPAKVVAASGPVSYYELGLTKRLVSFLFYCIAKGTHQVLPVIQGGNFIVDKDALKEVGGFNTSIDFYGEDTDTAVRLSKVGKINFNLGMWIWSSARRMEREGMVTTGVRYIGNYFWIWLVGHPWSVTHNDIRSRPK